MTTVPLWVYKCNARNPPRGVVLADWEQFFREGRREWGSTQAIGSAASLRILREEMAEGDLVLAIQTNRRAAMGLCRVAEFDDYRGADGRWERDLILESVRRFHPPVRLYELKKAQRALAQVKALRQGPVQTLYATTPTEAGSCWKRAASSPACSFGVSRERSRRLGSGHRRGRQDLGLRLLLAAR